MKTLCKCGKLAVWFPPSDKWGCCDDCISSKDSPGCTCNYRDTNGEFAEIPEGVENVDWAYVAGHDNQYWQLLDEKQRPLPCCEFFLWEDGREEEN